MKATNSLLKKLNPMMRLPATIAYSFRYARLTLDDLRQAIVIVDALMKRGER